MTSDDLVQSYLRRLEEVDLYLDQGLKDGAVAILEKIADDLDGCELPDSSRDAVCGRVEAYRQKLSEDTASEQAGAECENSDSAESLPDPAQSFEYGVALMDGLFWQEAIHEFKRAAHAGYRTIECWELSGDCASLLERWQEAIQHYNHVYKDADTDGALKRKILLKITRCSQEQKKAEVKLSPAYSRSERQLIEQLGANEVKPHDPAATAVASLDQSVIAQLVDQRISSWSDEKGSFLAGKVYSYKVLNLLHVGMTSIVVELKEEETGRRLAGQIITGELGKALSPKMLFEWTHTQAMSQSRHLVRIYDLAYSGEYFFIVREHLPLSLSTFLSSGEPFPIPLAVLFAHRILEGLGDLHLRMGVDDQIRSTYHLDLRPSRILFWGDRPSIKINNGGLWKVIEKGSPQETAIRRLPLPFLAYRAPEQFRSYLARKRPPVFTDIYQFGTLFYEMLTGIPAFRASSYEEYEIQHCDQYPTPPKVWRPEIPDQLNEIIMKCLESDPMKRWRSATQISLLLEKPFHNYINPPRDGFYAAFVDSAK